MQKRTKVVVAGSVVVALAGGWFLFGRSESAPPPKYETAQVTRGRIVARVTATGTLSALVTVQVGSQVSGRIQKLFVDFNSRVKKGDLIATIDPQLFQAAVEQARANHVAAQGNLTKSRVQALDAQRQYERAKALAEQKLIALAELDTAQAGAEAARAAVAASQGQVAQAHASLNQAQVNFNYTKIISPIDGVVISRTVDVGQTVAASLQAPTLFTIAEDLAKMQVDTSVAEADVGRLRPGMEVTFTVDAYPSERFHGQIRQIRNAPQTVQNVVTYDAVVDVDNAELKLKPGMTANVTVVIAEKDDVLKVPNAAMRFRPSPELMHGAPSGRPGAAPTASAPAVPRASNGHGSALPTAKPSTTPAADRASDRRTVYRVSAEGRLDPVSIRIGATDGTTTEIVDGPLREGEAVVVDVLGSREGAPRQPRGFRRVL